MGTFNGRRIVILGCGYVGRALAGRMRAAGARVTALTRNPATAAQLQAESIDTVIADLADRAWHRGIAGPVDGAVLCVSASDPSPAGYRKSYVDGAASVLDWAASLQSAPGTLVYTSSTGVYPQGGGATVDESAPATPSHENGRVLVEAEEMLRRAAPAPFGQVFVLRLAGIYGPGRHSLLDQLRAGAEVINGRGDHRLNLIHRDDVVGAILACLASPQSGPPGGTFNVSDGAPATKEEVVGWLAARLGRPPPRFDATSPSIRRGGAGIPDRIISNGRLVRALGWQPRFRSYREGYEEILREL